MTQSIQPDSHATFAKEEEDEKINDGFNGFVCFQYFSMFPDGQSRWWHDGWWLGMGNELRMVFYDHYRDSRYFGYRLYDETKVKILKSKKYFL